MTDLLERARLLYGQKRYDLAAVELQRQLIEFPENPFAHCLLAMCLVNLDDPTGAQRESGEAIRLAPDLPHAHYTQAFVLARQNKLAPAERAIQHAIALDPWDVASLHLLAQIHLEQSNWRGALEASDRGLAIESDHVGCTNSRSRALIKLGRAMEALQAIDVALQFEPDNAASHANKGWALLEARKSSETLGHFREALRLEPGMQWARRGMITALKSQYLVYRIVLGYFFWMSRLPKNARFGVIGGLWLLNQVRMQVQTYPAFEIVCRILGGLYIAFCVTTWTADPLFNAALRFNPYGRYLLTRKQIVTSNFVAASLLVALLSFAAWLFRRHDGELLLGMASLVLTCLIAFASRASSRTATLLAGGLLGILAVVAVVGAIAAGL